MAAEEWPELKQPIEENADKVRERRGEDNLRAQRETEEDREMFLVQQTS